MQRRRRRGRLPLRQLSRVEVCWAGCCWVVCVCVCDVYIVCLPTGPLSILRDDGGAVLVPSAAVARRTLH